MFDLRKTAESIYYATPDENSATQNQETNEEEIDLTQKTRASVEIALKKTHQPNNPKPKSAAEILRDFAATLQNKQKRVISHIAKKTARTQDFGTSEFNKIYKISIPSLLKRLFKELEALGLKKIQTTKPTRHGRNNYYLIVKPVNDLSEEPKKTDQSKFKNGKTQYERVIRNLDFIPNKYRDVLLFLTLSSKHNNWVDYDEIFRTTGQNQKNASTQTQNLKELLPKIGIELLEEKNKKGKKHFYLAIPSKDEEKRSEFHKKEREKKEKTQLPNKQTTKPHRLSKILEISTSDVIKRNWPKRKPEDEWYEDKPKHTRRRLWEDAGGKEKLI